MKTRKHPFIGAWHVVACELNKAGKWKCNHESDPGQWIISFFPDGHYGEICRHENEYSMEQWHLDKSTGIISIFLDPKELWQTKCIFMEEDGGTYLYFYDHAPHIVPDPEIILRHHADMRYKLIRAGS